MILMSQLTLQKEMLQRQFSIIPMNEMPTLLLWELLHPVFFKKLKFMYIWCLSKKKCKNKKALQSLQSLESLVLMLNHQQGLPKFSL